MGRNSMRADLPIRIKRDGERGLTLVELIVTVTILAILASAALPIARFKVKRDRVIPTCKELLDRFEVTDIDIEEVPIEDVIRQIFAR